MFDPNLSYQIEIVNPLLMGSIPQMFNASCTFQTKKVTYDKYNQPIDKDAWQDVPTLQNIRCYKEPASGAEVRKPTEETLTNTYTIALDGYYPRTVVNETLRAVVNGTPYNITKVASDDTDTITFVTLEKVNDPTETDTSDDST